MLGRDDKAVERVRAGTLGGGPHIHLCRPTPSSLSSIVTPFALAIVAVVFVFIAVVVVNLYVHSFSSLVLQLPLSRISSFVRRSSII